MKHISDIAKMVAVAVLLLTTCSLAQARYVYRGNSTYSSDIVCTWDGRYLYRGRSTYSSDIVYTYCNGHVYQGRSTYSSDIVCTTDGHIPIPLLMLIM